MISNQKLLDTHFPLGLSYRSRTMLPCNAVAACGAKRSSEGNPMPRGPRPDMKRRRQISNLRAQGLSYRLIGQKLGVSRQCAHALLRTTDPEGLTSIVCCTCGRRIAAWRGPRPGKVFCLVCLPEDASVGHKIRAYRVAAGLSTRALAQLARIAVSSIGNYERGLQSPSEQNRAKLSQVLGVECLAALRSSNYSACTAPSVFA
jgi:DNA-binding CsgD family transcriptional regulator